MALEPMAVYTLMESAYRNGALEPMSKVFGDSLAQMMADCGLTMEDVLNIMDDADPEAVLRVDEALDNATPILKVLASEPVMQFVGRLLAIEEVQQVVVEQFKTWLAEKSRTGIDKIAKTC